MVSAIITCAGTGERAGFGFNKLLKDIGGITPIEKCLSTFKNTSLINQYIIVCRDEDEETFKKLALSLGLSPTFVRGGSTRALSVMAGLNETDGDIVVIHDGARPFVTEKMIAESIAAAKKYGSGIVAVPSTDTVCDCEEKDGEIFAVSSSRKNKYLVQTPQTFKTELIKKAYAAAENAEEFTDESGVYEKYIGACKIVVGSPENKKLTYREDFSVGKNLSCGTGFDLHRLTEGRKLILGGIEIPHTKGLLGHSDADVLLHAVMDAMLSSASLGDIGKFFPDTDPAFKDISSVILLEKVKEILKKYGYKLVNVTAVIMAEKPKLSPFVGKIRKNMSDILELDESKIGITCTTLEGIGTVGREEGIAVQAYVLTEKTDG